MRLAAVLDPSFDIDLIIAENRSIFNQSYQFLRILCKSREISLNQAINALGNIGRTDIIDRIEGST